MKKLVGVMLKKMFLREMGSQRKIVRGRVPSGLVSWASPSLAALSVFDVRSSKRTIQVTRGKECHHVTALRLRRWMDPIFILDHSQLRQYIPVNHMLSNCSDSFWHIDQKSSRYFDNIYEHEHGMKRSKQWIQSGSVDMHKQD